MVQGDAKSQSTKTWLDVGILPFDGRAAINEYLVDRIPCYTLFDKATSKAMLNKKFCEKILYSKNTLHIKQMYNPFRLQMTSSWQSKRLAIFDFFEVILPRL